MRYTDKKSIEEYIQFACGQTCGEEATHIRFGFYYNNSKKYILSLTPCIKNSFGYTMNLGLGSADNLYDMTLAVGFAPRFNAKQFEELATKYNKLVRNLVADNATAEQFKQCITDLITA